MRLLSMVVFFSFAFSLAAARSQTIQSELLDLENFFSNVETFDIVKKRRVSLSLLSLATEELDNLKTQNSRRQLDEAGISRMEMLSLAIAPMYGRRTTIAELDAYLDDSRNAQMIFNSIGQERITGSLVSNLKEVIKSKLANQFGNSFAPTGILNDETVRESLSLTAEQQSEYERIFERSKKKIRYGNKQTFDQLDKLYDKHLDNLLLLLRPSQRESAQQLIGQPVKWFKARSRLEMLIDREHPGVQITTNGKFLFAPDGRPMQELAPEELKKLEVPHIHQHLLPVFRSHFFAGELGLTKDQFELMSKVPKHVVMTSRHEEQRLDDFLAADEIGCPSVLESVFVDHQLGWFRNIEFQILTVKHRSSFGLMHPKVKDSLEISPTQSARIFDLLQIFERDAKSLAEELGLGTIVDLQCFCRLFVRKLAVARRSDWQ